MKSKVCFFTGTRAEYGLLKPLMKLFKVGSEFEFQLIASGMHLSPEFGLTFRNIEADSFLINEKVEILLSSDTRVGLSKAMGLGLISFSEALNRLQPDMAIVLGDRFESFAFAAACMVAVIPLAHLHGGEATEGLIDEPIRHSITKMSHLHFTSTEEYRRRVIQLGEQPDRVFNVGAIGIDNIKNIKLLSKQELESSYGFRFAKRNLLIVYHPVTLENNTSKESFGNLLDVLDKQKDTNLYFSYANADTDGRIINEMIEDFANKNQERVYSSKSYNQQTYLSLLKHVDAIVGNSSSGIIEAPSLKTATINIGDRQKGRVQADSVINCKPNIGSIINALDILYSDGFQDKLLNIKNPYGEGNTAKKIYDILHIMDFSNLIVKSFYNLSYE